MRTNKLRESLKNNKPSLGTRILSSWPGIVEIIGNTGYFDYIEFLSEYAPYDLYSLENMAMAAELHGISTMIKIEPEPKTYLAQRAIGAGFQSILFADIRTAKDAEECVKAVKAETPDAQGTYGCSMRRNTGYVNNIGAKELVRYLNDIVVVLMIEKKNAVDDLEEILSVPGVDMVHFGPNDYAMSIGLPGETAHPKVKQAEEKFINLSIEKGIAPRIHIERLDKAESYIKQGVRHFTLGIDVTILSSWLKANGKILRDKLFM